MSFKAGDKVKCIDNTNVEEYLAIGDAYTVDSLQVDYFLILNGYGTTGWYPHRFELIEKEKVMEKQFTPKPGDKVICMNGEEYTCCTLDHLKDTISRGISSTKPIFGVLGNNWQDWYSNGFVDGSESCSYDIKEVISHTEVKDQQETVYTPEDIRKAIITDLGWDEYSVTLLLQSLKKVTNPEYDEYLRLKAIFESTQYGCERDEQEEE